MLQMNTTQVRIGIRNLQVLIQVMDPPHLQLDHSKMDRSHTNVTTVEDGGIAVDSAQVRGALVGGAQVEPSYLQKRSKAPRPTTNNRWGDRRD